MRILKRSLNGKGAGSVKIEAEEDDDMYCLFNLIAKGDTLEAMTVRNVRRSSVIVLCNCELQVVSESKSGARDKARVQTRMTITVDKVEFDAEQCALRVNGMNSKENPHIKLGQFHTIEIELNRPFDLEKASWDSVHLDVLNEASDTTKKAEIAALVMQEGQGQLCLIKSSLTRTMAHFSYEVGKKKPVYSSGGGSSKGGAAGLDKATLKFFDEMYGSLRRHVNFESIKVVLVGSPGSLAEEFLRYLSDRCIREEDTVVIKNRSKCLRATTSCGNRKAIEEMLSNPDLLRQLGNVKAVDEVKALNTFLTLFDTDPLRTAYGWAAVESAASQQAIGALLITDRVYRTDDFAERAKFVDLMDLVTSAGGQVYKFSSQHVSGERLDCFTGVAATLRFSVEVAELHLDEEEVREETTATVAQSSAQTTSAANTTVFKSLPSSNQGSAAKSATDNKKPSGNNKPAKTVPPPSKTTNKTKKLPAVARDDDYYDY